MTPIAPLTAEIAKLRLDVLALTVERDEFRSMLSTQCGMTLVAEKERNMHLEKVCAQGQEIERLRTLLKECADDLEAELNARYDKTLDYPSQRLKYDRDMTPVREARSALRQNAPVVVPGKTKRGDVPWTGEREDRCPVCGGPHNIGNPCPGPS